MEMFKHTEKQSHEYKNTYTCHLYSTVIIILPYLFHFFFLLKYFKVNYRCHDISHQNNYTSFLMWERLCISNTPLSDVWVLLVSSVISQSQIEVNQDITLTLMRRRFWVEPKEGLSCIQNVPDWSREREVNTLTKFSEDMKWGSVISTNDAREKMQSPWRR